MKFSLFSAVILVIGLTLANAYRPPNMDKKIFDAENIEMNPITRAALFTGLIYIARDFDEENHEVDYELRAHALAIAGRLDPESETFKDVNQDLQDRGRTTMEDNSEVSEAIRKIYVGVRSLMREEDNEDNMKCAAYCIDIALRLDPESRYADKLKELKDKTGEEADWDDMLLAPVTPGGGWWTDEQDRNDWKERTETIPGGKADKFPATQRTVYGLMVRTLSNGRHAGGASQLSATALREPDSDEIEFHIDQKVGDMFGNSLEEVQKLMRVRHEEDDRIPAGYKVEITFEDKDTLVDGPSAGTAMSIILDSLFTGLELDDKFAVTGAITATGKVGVIGGVAGKIRGATKKGCKLVGVPHDNIKGVSDILVLDGIQPLMDIQVFSFKTLDDALKVAAKDKDEGVQQTIDDFNKVADLVAKKGEEPLSNPKVIEVLESVVEKMPNHQSAQILLSVAKGEEKKVLSLGGSFHQINVRISGIARKLSRMMFMERLSMNSTEREQAKEALTELEEISSNLDPRLKDYNNAMLEVMKIYSEGRGEDESDEDYMKRLSKKWEEASAERKVLMDDPEIMEELLN